jgi:radical SAM superfamily enzyme YgiQ (UPF0313 family)
MTPIVCVSAGMRAPKKRDTPLSRLHLYLNYGLLGLATRLNNSGQPSIVLHGGFSSPESFADIPISYLRKSTKPLLLSLPSSFALGWARDFCAVVKQAVPHSRIVVGGRWVTASDGAWIRRQIPDADLVVYGTAESRIEKLVDPASWSTVGATDRYLLGKSIPNEVQLPALDFRLVDGFLDYQPCIEISRGCGMGCNFCAEASEPLSQPRPVPEVVRELLNLSAVYSGDIHPYFQASFFRPSSQWIDELKARIMARDIMVQWRTETRVDGLAPGQIEGLARAGLKVLDLGLESASLVQLRRMGEDR